MSQQCRTDGRCQYAIDHGAEGLGHCPVGKCAMPPRWSECPREACKQNSACLDTNNCPTFDQSVFSERAATEDQGASADSGQCGAQSPAGSPAQTEARPTPKTDTVIAACAPLWLSLGSSAPGAVEGLCNLARTLEREAADLRSQLAEARAKEREYDWLLGKMVHQQSGPNVGWTLDILLPGDCPREATQSALTDEAKP